MCHTKLPPEPLRTCSTMDFIKLVHAIKIAASASRGVPDGATLALREIIDLINHFEATH